MSFKNKIYFIILGLVGQLFFFGNVATEPAEARDIVLGQEIILPTSAPEHRHLTLVSFYPLVVEGEIVGAVAVYDDATTERPAAYLELYDSIGDLLAVRWFDRFGIERMAVDRGLLGEADELEGVLVPLLVGDSI